eukprot:2512761-Rhodomonas_salina.1
MARRIRTQPSSRASPPLRPPSLSLACTHTHTDQRCRLQRACLTSGDYVLTSTGGYSFSI